MRRTISILLVLCMMISFVPGISFAAEDSLIWTFGYQHTYADTDKTAESRYFCAEKTALQAETG